MPSCTPFKTTAASCLAPQSQRVTAEFVRGWPDELLTVNGKPEQVRKMLEAFHRGGAEGKPLLMQVGLNWAGNEDEALRGAYGQWHYNVLGGEVNWELRSPRDFETASRLVRAEDMREPALISADLGQHAARLREYLEVGFEELYLHQVGVNQREFTTRRNRIRCELFDFGQTSP